MGSTRLRLERLGITLPKLAAPSGNYVPCRISGNTLYVSGQVPRIDGVDAYQGIVGQTISRDEAHEAARVAAINMLAQVARALDGDLDRVTGCLQLRGFVNAAPGFTDHPAVIDGASDLIVAVLGDCGRHARTALGAGTLPRAFAVEIDAIFEIRP
ncbi:RidA family protein [Paracoccus aestuariivivens]|uniref:RidA family protein n=1 Tax=Paracoccus aestuariivivens TaxID=1820333 RepID=A0A6L6JA38_9RHOB|nr:RidA family protein [Paracoccus aestuariivivens]MTH78416.1 RidA family protein [Paracoccus aestuariivivens]